MITIGKYKEIYKEEQLPSMFEHIDYPYENKNKILMHMKRSKIEASTPSMIKDIFDGRTSIDLCFYTDGKYCWRSDVMYYFEKYDLELEDEFIQFVLNSK